MFQPCYTMVTVQTENFNTFSQEIYNGIIDRLQIQQITCTCGQRGCMRKYGHYKRVVWFLSDDVTLDVQRIQCTHCRRTHAVLLDILVPYSRIPMEDQIQILIAFENGASCEAVQQANYLIEDGMVLYIRRKYFRYWKQKLLSAGISLSLNLVADCFRCYGCQFMQIRRTPNILFSPST